MADILDSCRATPRTYAGPTWRRRQPGGGAERQKSCAYSGEQSVFLARRADAGISGIFQGGATPPGTPRAFGIGTGLLRRDTSLGAWRFDALQLCSVDPARRSYDLPSPVVIDVLN